MLAGSIASMRTEMGAGRHVSPLYSGGNVICFLCFQTADRSFMGPSSVIKHDMYVPRFLSLKCLKCLYRDERSHSGIWSRRRILVQIPECLLLCILLSGTSHRS